MSQPHTDHSEGHSSWGDQQGQRAYGRKIGPKNSSHQIYIAVCVRFFMRSPWGAGGAVVFNAEGPPLGNPLEISVLNGGSKQHKVHSHVQPNSFSKWRGILGCNPGCAVRKYLLCVPCPHRSPSEQEAVIKSPAFIQVALIMFLPSFSLWL